MGVFEPKGRRVHGLTQQMTRSAHVAERCPRGDEGQARTKPFLCRASLDAEAA
jgi:hypothetical protein